MRPQNGLAGQSDGARSACSLAHASSSPEPSHQLLEKREGQEHLGQLQQLPKQIRILKNTATASKMVLAVMG